MAMSKGKIVLLVLGGGVVLSSCMCLGMCSLIIGSASHDPSRTDRVASSKPAPSPEEKKVALAPEPQPESPKVDQQPKPQPAPAVTVESSEVEWREVNEIYSLSSDSTRLQKEEEWKRFKGKHVRWTGTVSEVSESWGSMKLQVKMNPDTLTSDLLIYLDSSDKSKALRLKSGSKVTFTGVLDDWGSLLPITIKDGHLVG